MRLHRKSRNNQNTEDEKFKKSNVTSSKRIMAIANQKGEWAKVRLPLILLPTLDIMALKL